MSHQNDLLVTGGAMAGSLFASILTGLEDARPVLPPGMRFGNYRIVREIGRGGGGRVYRAERCDGTYEQAVALKVTSLPAESRALALSELRILAQLTHPAIARLYDGGETPTGEIWFAMELIDGEPLDAYCRRVAAGWRTRLDILIAVADALGFAHARQIVHCDVKPTNILVDPAGRPHLIDFGVASVGQDATRPARMTLAYASPEQLLREPVTPASDVFQLGRVIEDTLLASGVAPNLVTKRNLEGVVAAATHESVSSRFADGDGLRKALVALREQRPAGPLPLADRALLLLSRRRRLIALGGLLAVLLTVFHYQTSQLLTQERTRTVAEASRTAAVSRFIIDLYRSIPAQTNSRLLSSERLLDIGAQRALPSLEASPDRTAAILEALAAAYACLNRHDRAAGMLEEAIGRLSRMEPAPQLPLIRLRATYAELLVHLDRPEQARAEIAEAEEALAAEGFDHWGMEHALLEHARVALLDTEGRSIEANAARDALINRLDRSGARMTGLYVTALTQRSVARNQQQDDVEGAIGDAIVAHEIAEALYGSGSCIALAARIRLVFLFMEHGRQAQAELLMVDQLETVTAQYGDGSLEQSEALVALAMQAEAAGTPDEAISLYRRALAVKKSLIEAGDSELGAATAEHNLGWLLAENGRVEEGIESLTAALSRRQRLGVHGGATPQAAATNLAINQLHLAVALCSADRFAEAEAGLAAARASFQAQFPPEHSFSVAHAIYEAECAVRQGDTARAKALYDDSVTETTRPLLTARERTRRRLEALEQALGGASRMR